MPMYAVLDAIVNLDKFRNVDLVQQGFYRISVRLQGLRSGTPAVPLATYPSDRSGTLGCDDMGEGAAEGMQSFLDSRENAYVTRPFYVRYNDHTACLCEMAHFRLELDCSVSVRELEDVLVRFDLQFAVRPKSEGGASAAAAAAAGPGDVAPAPEDYSVISTHDFQLRGAVWLGAHVSVPLTFEEHSVSCTAVTLHTVLTDIRFTPDAMPPASPRGAASAQGELPAAPSPVSPLPSPPSAAERAASAAAGSRTLPGTVAQQCGAKRGSAMVPLARADEFTKRWLQPLFASFVALRASLQGCENELEDCPVLNLPESLELEPLRYRALPPPAPLPRRRSLRVVAGGTRTEDMEATATAMWRAYTEEQGGEGDGGGEEVRAAEGDGGGPARAEGEVEAARVADGLLDALHGTRPPAATGPQPVRLALTRLSRQGLRCRSFGRGTRC